MKLHDLKRQLLDLTPQEKAEAIQFLSQSLANSWQGIEKNEGVCGGKACIAGTRITVWGLVNARKIGYSETDLLANPPSLSACDLANAWSYAEIFTSEIESDIQENEEEIE
ncbi:MAG: DUF433 domain-containing protein [Microcystaceae cyanobacterium]